MGLREWLTGIQRPQERDSEQDSQRPKIPYALQIDLLEERMNGDERAHWEQLKGTQISTFEIKRQAEQDNARAYLAFQAYRNELIEKYLTEDEQGGEL